MWVQQLCNIAAKSSSGIKIACSLGMKNSLGEGMMKRTLRMLFVVGLVVVATLGTSAIGGASAQEKTPGALTFDPSSVEFGDQVSGQASKPVRITVTNSGGSDLYVNSVTMGGDNSSDFVLVSDPCSGATIKPGKSCVIDVVMTPGANGARRGELVFNANGGSQTVTLAGNGINSSAVPPQ